ncbi:flagellar M-ring protein FliF [Bacillus timonensis]|nr:flagellar M-ring protein FliF [Bacillus timonensis]
MNENLIRIKNTIVTFWENRSKTQKNVMVGALVLVVLISSIVTFVSANKEFEPLYSNLSPQETGQIKETLDSRGILSEVAENGTTIKVPKEVVNTLKVELAAEGIPNSGNIDYTFFGQNAGFGMTDNEFNVLKVEAMQTELANLVKSIDGVNDAKVMITLPEPSIFVNDDQNMASASIVLNTKLGYKFSQEQIKSLYHLVSKSVPNLPTDNIVIMNQMFEYFDLKNENNSPIVGNITSQLELKREIERDIQRQVQQMLGTMMGQDKVVVSVTADLDFTQENREENIVAPVDQENMDGIEISVERITESYTGNNPNGAGGVTGSGDGEVTNYPGTDTNSGNGDYERIEERVNKDVNRIRKEIVESPYKIRDLGIQVMVEPPDPENPATLSEESVEDITKILSTIVRTTVHKDAATQLTEEELKDKVVVSVQQFNGKVDFDTQGESLQTNIPLWVYIVGGVLVFLIIILLILFLKKRKTNENEEFEEQFEQDSAQELPDLNIESDSETTVRRKQLEKMAKDKPEEFAKLLRTWLAED